MSSHKKNYLKGDYAAGVYLSEAPNPVPLSPNTLLTCIQYTYSHRGEGELKKREGERDNGGEYRSQSWVENTNMTERKKSAISSL